MALLKPKYYVSSFEHMSIERLKQQGIKLLLCDIDNTLVSYDEKHPSPSVIAFIDRVKSSGIEVALCSNATKERATRFSKVSKCVHNLLFFHETITEELYSSNEKT